MKKYILLTAAPLAWLAKCSGNEADTNAEDATTNTTTEMPADTMGTTDGTSDTTGTGTTGTMGTEGTMGTTGTTATTSATGTSQTGHETGTGTGTTGTDGGTTPPTPQHWFKPTEKGRWSDPAALKHGSAVGRPLPEVAFMP